MAMFDENGLSPMQPADTAVTHAGPVPQMQVPWGQDIKNYLGAATLPIGGLGGMARSFGQGIKGIAQRPIKKGTNDLLELMFEAGKAKPSVPSRLTDFALKGQAGSIDPRLAALMGGAGTGGYYGLKELWELLQKMRERQGNIKEQ